MRTGDFLMIVVPAISAVLAIAAFERWKRRRPPALPPKSRPIDGPPSNAFEYYPGMPTGYVGYTDYTAMCCDLNDDLLGRPADEQFLRVGFGEGLVSVLVEHLQDSPQPRTMIPISGATPDDEAIIGWINVVQRHGVDNYGPSTRNLLQGLQSTSRDLLATGPYRLGFWEKRTGEMRESLASTGLTLADLAALTASMAQARRRGAELAAATLASPAGHWRL